MPKYAAFFRGVNVGGGNRVPMATLRTVATMQGLGNARTVLNSGNLVFSSRIRSPHKLASQVCAMLRTHMRVDVPVIVKNAAQLNAVCCDLPWKVESDSYSTLLVGLSKDRNSLLALSDICALAESPAKGHVGEHALYLWCPGGVSKTKSCQPPSWSTRCINYNPQLVNFREGT